MIFVIAFERRCITNLMDLDGDLQIYGEEEADTGIDLHSIKHVSKIRLVN